MPDEQRGKVERRDGHALHDDLRHEDGAVVNYVDTPVVEFDHEAGRVVGIKNVSSDERYFIAGPGGVPVLPASILTEAMAQAGAVLILSKPENLSRLIYFMGIDRVRYRRPVRPGDTVEIEARVKRLRSRMGQLYGFARVGGTIVLAGTMTFALGPVQETAGATDDAPPKPD